MLRSIIYGPVPSWRLGRSLGIDLISTQGKTCSFDCIYCQLGKTINRETERRVFVSLDQLDRELIAVEGLDADYATFSGVGEPSLAANLGEAIELVKSVLKLPVAVLTNSSLLPREDVRQALSLADVVVAKVDAPDEQLFQKINRPAWGWKLAEILKSVKDFRKEYLGKLSLQMMFLEANRNSAVEMARIARQISPDEVQINTPLRLCAVKPLDVQQIAAIRVHFYGCQNVITVYESPAVKAIPLNPEETLLRRPSQTV